MARTKAASAEDYNNSDPDIVVEAQPYDREEPTTHDSTVTNAFIDNNYPSTKRDVPFQDALDEDLPLPRLDHFTRDDATLSQLAREKSCYVE